MSGRTMDSAAPLVPTAPARTASMSRHTAAAMSTLGHRQAPTIMSPPANSGMVVVARCTNSTGAVSVSSP